MVVRLGVQGLFPRKSRELVLNWEAATSFLLSQSSARAVTEGRTTATGRSSVHAHESLLEASGQWRGRALATGKRR